MRTHQALFDQPAPLSNNDALLVALFIAAVIHVAVGLGVNFTVPQPKVASRSIDITLVNMPSQKAPEKAHSLAQDNQEGAGEKAKKTEPPPQQLPIQGNAPSKQAKKVVSEQVEAKTEKKLITQKKTEKKAVAAVKPEAAHPQHPQLSAEMLQQQIAQLGTEIKLSQQNTEQTKIEFVDSVSAAHKYVAAQYEMDWTNKIENVGNKVFPEEAKNFSGTLTMDVGIKKDGSIYSIRINQSSGNLALDNWAKKIVRNNAPYALLPSELLQELDVLVITRVWKFSDESGMSSR